MPGGSSPLAFRDRSSFSWLKASPSTSANGRGCARTRDHSGFDRARHAIADRALPAARPTSSSATSDVLPSPRRRSRGGNHGIHLDVPVEDHVEGPDVELGSPYEEEAPAIER